MNHLQLSLLLVITIVVCGLAAAAGDQCVCVRTDGSLNVRACPRISSDCAAIGSVTNQWCLVHLETNEFNWHKVQFEGQEGWVSGKYTSEVHTCATKDNGMCAHRMCAADSNEPRGCDVKKYGCGYYGASRAGGARIHKGSDIKCTQDDDVLAPYDGEITRVDVKPYGDGTCCDTGFEMKITQFAGGYKLKVFYAKPSVAKNAKVKKGDKIAKHAGLHCGCYTKEMTDHVHFQLTKGGTSVDSTSFAFCQYKEKQEICEENLTLSLANFLRIVKVAESSGESFKYIANSVREQGYGGLLFDYLAGATDGADDLPKVSSEDAELMKMMIGHSANSNGLEKGVVLTPSGDTIAMGHVLTGICSGLKRDTNLKVTQLYVSLWHWDDWEGSLDNLHAATLAGDLGQSTLRWTPSSSNLLGPGGTWDSTTCPIKYTLNGLSSEATDAEILGDIDGFIIGTVLKSVLQQKPDMKLSDLIQAYYSDGIGTNKRFKSSARISLFKELVGDYQLQEETEAFTRVYANRYDLPLNRVDHIPATIQQFFEHDIMKDCTQLPEMHTITYFIQLLKSLEQESSFKAKDMSKHLLHLSSFYRSRYAYEEVMPFFKADNKKGATFEWYVASNYFIHPGLVDGSSRELGVLEDSIGNVLTIGNVVLGIHAGFNEHIADHKTLYDATIIGGMLEYDKPRPSPTIGSKGRWDDSCPKKFLAGNSKTPTHAQMIGSIDGLILGYWTKVLYRGNDNIYLSSILEQYYTGNGINNGKVKSTERFKEVVSILSKEGGTLQDTVTKSISLLCREATDEDPETLRITDCTTYSVSAGEQLTTFLSHGAAASTQSCGSSSLGDLMKLHPSGASKATSGSLTPGVEASQKLVDNDIARINGLKHCFDSAGQTTGVHPALIAAMASRESRAGDPALLNSDGFSIYEGNDGYGVMQCDPASNLPCTKYGPRSCEHITMMIQQLFLKDYESVKKKLPSWKPEQWLQGAVAAYNFGVDDVRTWSKLDIGSTHDDYSGDIVARAQWLITKHKWTFCGNQGSQTSISTDDVGLFGDLMKLSPSGASFETSTPNSPGLSASRSLLDADSARLDRFKDCFNSVGRTLGIPPALIAAVVSKDSSAGLKLSSSGYNKNGNGDYGLMQCTPSSAPECTKHAWDSCEHVQMMTEKLVELIGEVKKKFPREWSSEQWLQGAVAAYDFGIGLVQTWRRLDIGSKNNDFSDDIIARAQWLARQHGWTLGLPVPAISTGIPAISTLLENYPAYPPSMAKVVKSDTELAQEFMESTYTVTDAMRVSYMLCNIPGHKVWHTVAGSKKGENGMVYYDRASKVKQYLTERYSSPLTFSTTSELENKHGILYVSYGGANDGKIGIWSGKSVHGADDFTAGGNQFFLWESQIGGGLLASDGNCEFYKEVIEKRLPCGPTGYALGYGYKYCSRFGQYYDEFTTEGKAFVDGVRKCLMEKLQPFVTVPKMTCKKLHEIALDTHVPCYVDHGFCDVMAQPQNCAALIKVYEFADFLSIDALKQVVHTISQCAVSKTLSTPFACIWSFKDKISTLFSNKSPSRETDSQCVQYAQEGDCKFYECFEEKFECIEESHSINFELPSCLEFDSVKQSLSTKGKKWLKDTQKCMMLKLLPIYYGSTMKCSNVSLALMDQRIQCMIESGFCDIIHDDLFFIDRSVFNHGYPQILNRRPFTLPISGKSSFMDSEYYKELGLLRRDIGLAAAKCRNKPTLYKSAYNEHLKKTIKQEL